MSETLPNQHTDPDDYDTRHFEDTLEDERESRMTRVRSLGGTAAKAIVKFGQERLQDRRNRKQDAEEDYVLGPERPLGQLITDDKEVLGEHPTLLRGGYRKTADKITKEIGKAEAHTGTAGAREKYLQHRNNRTDIKIARIQNKLKNSSGSFISKQIDRQRRQTLENLRYKKKIHTGQLNKLEKKRGEKPEELRKKIDMIVDKKLKAFNRKAQRKVLREQHGISKHNFVKRNEFLAKMSQRDKQKIMREAIRLVRKANIEKGLLDPSYQVDENVQTRKIGDHYERTTE